MTEVPIARELLDRRAAIERVMALVGGTLVGGSALWSGCRRAPSDKAGQPKVDVALLDQVAETILPATDTPGAKAAKVGAFMAMMVADCYDEAEQRTFYQGIEQLDQRSRTVNRVDFLAATPAQRTALLTTLDREQHDYMAAKQTDQPAHYFRMMKELALLGYFTSELGATQSLRYVAVPGRYDPCLDLQPGQRSWAP